METKHGGKRKGSGRKKSAPTIVYQLKLDMELDKQFKTIPVKIRNQKLRELITRMVAFHCV